MQELFKVISTNQLTPNQTYLLYSIRDQTTPQKINVNMELRTLTPDWVNPGTTTLTSKSIQFLNQIDTLSNIQSVKIPAKVVVKTKSSTPEQLTGEDYLKNIATYREMFPAGMLPSGVASRVSIPELEKRFKTFFTVFPQYTWEQVHLATKRYIDKYENENFMYMKNSSYFIYKEDKSLNRTYDLASRIDMLDQGDVPQDEYYTPPSV